MLSSTCKRRHYRRLCSRGTAVVLVLIGLVCSILEPRKMRNRLQGNSKETRLADIASRVGTRSDRHTKSPGGAVTERAELKSRLRRHANSETGGRSADAVGQTALLELPRQVSSPSRGNSSLSRSNGELQLVPDVSGPRSSTNERYVEVTLRVDNDKDGVAEAYKAVKVALSSLYKTKAHVERKPLRFSALSQYEPLYRAAAAYCRSKAAASNISDGTREHSLVVLSSVNYGFRNVASNWLCSLDALRIHNVVVLAQDRRTQKFFQMRGRNVQLDPLHELLSEHDVAYGTYAYQLLMHSRTRMVWHLLEAGLDVLIADNDAWWFKNPFDALGYGRCWQGGLPCIVINPPKPPRTSAYDVHIQVDRFKEHWINHDMRTPFVCGGFVLLRACSKGKSVFRNQVQVGYGGPDDLIYSKNMDYASPPTLLCIIMKVRTFWSKVMLGHQEILRKPDANFELSNIKVEALNESMFPSGATFDWDTSTHAGVVVAHNNFIVGKESKVKRFHKANLWRIDDQARCLSSSDGVVHL